jgi:CheY-like chemotaxis protein
VNARHSILLVDADAKSLRVLEVSLRKVGYDVRTAETAASALQSALTSPPDLVITDTRLPDYDGFDLCRRIRRDPRTEHAILVFLAADATPELKVRGIDVGADEFLTKPVLVKEIVSRVRSLIERRASSALGGRGGLSGTLSNMGIVDVLQVMDAGNKSGTLRVVSDPVRSGGFVEGDREEGVIFFRDGRPVDAQVGRLRGADAIYRLLLWEDGVFEAAFGPVESEDVIGMSTQDILLEGLQRVDAWSQHLQGLPGLRSRLRVDLEILGRRRAPPPREVQDLIARFDGRRTLFEVIASSPLDELHTLRVLQALHEEGALQPADESTGDVEALEAWLASSEPARAPDDLPSALEEAVIPSPQTPSEIISAHDPRESRIPLVRQTLPSSYVGPLPSRAPEPAQPQPLPAQRPNLRVQRVPSGMPPSAPAASGWAPGGARGPEDAGWDTVEIPPSVSESFRDPTQPPAPGRAPAETPGWPSPPPRPTTGMPDSQRDVPTWDLGPRGGPPAGERRRFEAPGHPPAPSAPPAEAGPQRPLSSAAPASSASSPWSEVTESSSASVQAQAAALPQNPSVYRPSETSTFRDDFFKEGGAGEAGLDPKILVGVAAALVAIVLFFLLQAGPTEEVEPTAEKEAPAEKSPEEKAAAAMAATATATVAAGPDAGAPDVGAATEVDAGAAPDEAVAALGGGTEGETPPKAETPEPPPARSKPLPRLDRSTEPGEPAPPPRARGSVRSMVREGRELLETGDIARAEARFRAALDRDDDNPAALAGQALVFWERRQDDQARAYANRALGGNRREPLAHLVLGLIAAQGDDRDEAKRSYQNYLKLEPRGFYAEDVRASLETLN